MLVHDNLQHTNILLNRQAMCLYISALRISVVNYTCLVADMWLITSGKCILQVTRKLHLPVNAYLFKHRLSTRYGGKGLKVYSEREERRAWNFHNYS